MDGESGSGMSRALLAKSGSGKRGRLKRRNSVNSLRNDFFSRLPGKVRYGLDTESAFHIDISKTKGLTQGLSLSILFLYSIWGMPLLSAFSIFMFGFWENKEF